MLEVRIRACHVHGRFATRDNVRPSFPLARALDAPSRDTNRIVLPPASFLHEKEKIEQRWPAAVEFIHARGMNETFDGDIDDIGIIMQGGMYNGVIRRCARLGLADIWGETRVPLYVMNVTYPIVDREVIEFCRGKKAVLMVEEGQPEFIEQALHKILRNADIPAKLHGKDLFPMAGEYTSQVMGAAIGAFIRRWARMCCRHPPARRTSTGSRSTTRSGRWPTSVPPRPPGFCTGCPERPIFSAMKLVEKELGIRTAGRKTRRPRRHHVGQRADLVVDLDPVDVRCTCGRPGSTSDRQRRMKAPIAAVMTWGGVLAGHREQILAHALGWECPTLRRILCSRGLLKSQLGWPPSTISTGLSLAERRDLSSQPDRVSREFITSSGAARARPRCRQGRLQAGERQMMTPLYMPPCMIDAD